MKATTIGVLATLGSHVDPLNLLECSGFDLSKKVFQREDKGGSRTYYQAESDEENRILKRTVLDSFFLASAKAHITKEGEHVRAFR